LTELSLPSNIQINFPEGKEKPMHFEISIKPDEGYYRNGKFLFDFQISTGYPYDAPKVKCKTKVRAETPASLQHGRLCSPATAGGTHSQQLAHAHPGNTSVLLWCFFMNFGSRRNVLSRPHNLATFVP
jgi:hypothetical protein